MEGETMSEFDAVIDRLDGTMLSELSYLAVTTADSTETVTGAELVALGLAVESVSSYGYPGVTITPLGRRVMAYIDTHPQT